MHLKNFKELHFHLVPNTLSRSLLPYFKYLGITSHLSVIEFLISFFVYFVWHIPSSHLLQCVLWPRMLYILMNVPNELEKNVYLFNVLKYSMTVTQTKTKFISNAVWVTSIFANFLTPDISYNGLPINYYQLLMEGWWSLWITLMNLSISPFSCILTIF